MHCKISDVCTGRMIVPQDKGISHTHQTILKYAHVFVQTHAILAMLVLKCPESTNTWMSYHLGHKNI